MSFKLILYEIWVYPFINIDIHVYNHHVVLIFVL